MAKPLPVAAVVLPREVQGVGALPDGLRQAGHLSDTVHYPPPVHRRR